MKKLVAKVGEYQKNGETKGRYVIRTGITPDTLINLYMRQLACR